MPKREKLAVHVTLRDEHGLLVQFAPGDVLPAWAAKRVTNPDAFKAEAPVEVDEAPAEDQTETEGDGTEADKATGDGDAAADDSDEVEVDEAPAEDETTPVADETPDFTKPAPRRGRARKQG